MVSCPQEKFDLSRPTTSISWRGALCRNGEFSCVCSFKLTYEVQGDGNNLTQSHDEPAPSCSALPDLGCAWKSARVASSAGPTERRRAMRSERLREGEQGPWVPGHWWGAAPWLCLPPRERKEHVHFLLGSFQRNKHPHLRARRRWGHVHGRKHTLLGRQRCRTCSWNSAFASVLIQLTPLLVTLVNRRDTMGLHNLSRGVTVRLRWNARKSSFCKATAYTE